MAEFTTEPMTYGRLNEALLALGFERRGATPYTIYDYGEEDAVIALPAVEADAKIRPAHQVVAASAVTLWKLASENEFVSLLMQKRTRPPARRAAASLEKSAA